jgi:hypothetical protein
VNRLQRALWARRHPAAPWLTRGAVRFLIDWLRRSDQLVEFGSGRSTVWFAQRVKRVISIESSPEWHAKVRQLLPRGAAEVDLRLATDEESYVFAATAALGTDQADVILVDGAFRAPCALWAIGHLAAGGLLVIDNANWYLPSSSVAPGSVPLNGDPLPEWKQVWAVLGTWRLVWMLDGVTETLLCFKGATAA